MRIAIVGAGAMGGLMGVKLALAGQTVTFIDRGRQLAALQDRGIKLIMGDGTEHCITQPRATADFDEAGPQDAVILGLKAYDIEAVAPRLPKLFGPDTFVVTIQNGIPWWYFQKHGGPHDGYRLEALDPGGLIEEHIPPDRIVGCVAYPAAAVPEPGVIQHVEGDRFPIGELDGTESARCERLHQALTGAGFRSRIIHDIRSELWLKAWGTLSFNPISALTRATLVDICRFPPTRDLAATMMEEARAIAATLGVEFRRTIEQRIAGAEGVGPHKTSMLQDVEAGLPLEVEALIGSVLELARLTGTPAPSIEAVYACTKLLESTYTEEASAAVSSSSTP